MRKPVLVVALSVAVTLLILGMRAVVDGGSRPAEAGAAVQPNAHVELVGSSQSWKVTSKGDFPFDRVIVKVSAPGAVAKATFKCQGTGETVVTVTRKNPAAPPPEVWSGTFLNGKCVETDNSGHVVPSGVNVTLEPVNPAIKLAIDEVRVQNTTLPQVGAINFRRIASSPRNFLVTFKDLSKGYNRVDLDVSTLAGSRKIRFSSFMCKSTGEELAGAAKGPPTAGIEVWSVTFAHKCTDGVRVHFVPVVATNRVVVKAGHAENTTRPREASANASLKAKSERFKLTSQANFAADRVDVEVAMAQNALPAGTTRKVSSAVFECQKGTAAAKKVNGSWKRTIKNFNPTPLPDIEVWSADFGLGNKCIPAFGSVTVTLVPSDPLNQLVIKAAFVENTETPTPVSVPTPTGVNGSCVAGAQHQPFPHRPDQPFWDFWKCTPSSNIDWNRVDILIGKPDQRPKVKAIQFDCQTRPPSKANTISFKGHIKGQPGEQDMELWSGTNFKPALGAPLKNCQGGVSIAIAMWDPDNHPRIKKAFFSHTGAAKVPPPKLPSNGHCDPASPPSNDWLCNPDPVAPYNRVDIKVASPAIGLQLAGVQMICPNGDVGVVGLKGQKVGATAADPPHEVWSADFPRKCDGAVSVTLKPFVANTFPEIISVNFSNPPKKPPANGVCDEPTATQIDWFCHPDPALQFTRIDIKIGTTGGSKVAPPVVFTCRDDGRVVQVTLPKSRKENSGAFPFVEVWSADFLNAPCTGVDVSLRPANPGNPPVIKHVVFDAPAS